MPETNKPGNKHSSPERLSFIWESFRQGQSWAFRKLYMDMYESLYSYGLSILSSEPETRDLIQDLFIKLWNRRKRLPKARNIKAYLFVAFRTTILDFYRVKKNRTGDPNDLPARLQFTFSVEEQLIKDETDADLARRISDAIGLLNEREKEIVYLRFFHDLEYKEIGKVMGIRYQSVRNLMHKALLALRKNL